MRIAQVAPLYESVPPRLYGGTERVVSYLTEELVRTGHEVTLFASGDSRTSARLVAGTRHSLRLDATCHDPLAHHCAMLDAVWQRRHDFDVVHFHVDYLHFPMSRALDVPHVTTLHGRLDRAELQGLYRAFADVPLVSISDAQREPLPWVNWRGTVYHGLPRDLLQLHEPPGDYLAFLGRVSPEKGVDRAIAIAQAARLPLRIAAKVDGTDRAWFEQAVQPLLAAPGVEMLGEITQAQKDAFLGGARALLFPIEWPEPFGLVMIESFACGTPVIAYARGSVPEIVDHGATGFLVDDEDDAVRAIAELGRIRRRDCRTTFETRFSVERMTEDYLAVYGRLLEATPVRADGGGTDR